MSSHALSSLKSRLQEQFSCPLFWEHLMVSFCVFSVVGHWMEIPYCLFMDQFGIVDDSSLVWDDPFYPFLVYGVGVVLCALILVPLASYLYHRFSSRLRVVSVLFLVATGMSLVMELAMGLLLNQPDPYTGLYPLWDNSALPGNIFGQAWIVNDIGLGAIATLYTCFVYPFTFNLLCPLRQRQAVGLTLGTCTAFIVLCVVKFS